MVFARLLKNYSSFELVLGLTNRPILLIECVPIDRWPSFRQGFHDRLSILSIKNKIKILTDWLIVSIDTINIDLSIHRRLCPAMIPRSYAEWGPDRDYMIQEFLQEIFYIHEQFDALGKPLFVTVAPLIR